MIAGMFVIHNGTVCQVLRIIADAQRSWAGMPEPSSTYELQPLDGGMPRQLRNPLAVDIPLVPRCETCGTRAGMRPCGSGRVPHDWQPKRRPKPRRVPPATCPSWRGRECTSASCCAQAAS